MGIFKTIKQCISFTKHMADDVGRNLSDKSSELLIYTIQKKYNSYVENLDKITNLMHNSVPENQWNDMYKRSLKTIDDDYYKTKKQLSKIISESIESNNIQLYKNCKETEDEINVIYNSIRNKFIDINILSEHIHNDFEKLLERTENLHKQRRR